MLCLHRSRWGTQDLTRFRGGPPTKLPLRTLTPSAFHAQSATPDRQTWYVLYTDTVLVLCVSVCCACILHFAIGSMPLLHGYSFLHLCYALFAFFRVRLWIVALLHLCIRFQSTAKLPRPPHPLTWSHSLMTHICAGLKTAENAVIFNIGVIEKRGFDAFSVTIISLSANGYQNQTGETATAGMATQTQLQHGFTYCCHKTSLESGVLNVQIMNGDQVVAEQSIPVKSLVGKASSKKVRLVSVSSVKALLRLC